MFFFYNILIQTVDILYVDEMTLKYILLNVLIYMVTISHAIEISLSEGWTITNANQSIQIHNEQIPSGVYTALQNANITDSILNSYNDVNLRWIARDKWKYTLDFGVTDDILNHSHILLVFHGIDTIATITINNHELLPNPNNMFTRYRYDVADKLITSSNNLEIQFQSPIEVAKKYATENSFTPPECPNQRYHGECHMNQLRKMQASFSWDWGLAAPSVGIWKAVTLEVYDTAIIRDITYTLHSLNDEWQIDLSVYLECGVGSKTLRSFQGYLFVNLMDVPQVSDIEKQIIVSRSRFDSFKETISFTLSKNLVELWWPNGFGNQTLYRLNVTWLGENRDIFTNEIKQIPIEYLRSEKVIRIGFRTIELQEDDTSDGNLFYFNVNDIPIFMKGTNLIPIDILPEKMFNKDKIEYLILSAKDAHMNSIRVWGGGVYESDYFYDLADEHGLLIWQDMMFACAMYPIHSEFLASVEIEIIQNIRRLQHHSSILVWAGNNENEAALIQNWYGTVKEQARFIQEYIELYKNVIERAVRHNDQWHIWLYSSPSNGNRSDKVINENPQDNNHGDVHYYNYISDAWNPNIFPKARFISEYGFQSFPSLHSLEQTMYTTDEMDNLIDHRQHFPFGNLPIITAINRSLIKPKQSSANYWDTLIYFSQINQAMSTKIETETYRAGRFFEWKTMGALYWQLNDVWTAPSWSSIEYNGNFKLLHYWAKDFFAPTHVVANIDVLNKLNVFIIEDTIGRALILNLFLRIYNWSSLTPVLHRNFVITMTEKYVERVLYEDLEDFFNDTIDSTNSFMHFELKDNATDELLSTNFLLMKKFKKSKQITNPQLQYTITNQHCDPKTGIHSANIEVSVTAPAIFVYIKIKTSQIETYKLSKNGFIQITPSDLVKISFNNRNCAVAFTNDDLQVLTVNDFLTT